MIPIKLNQFKLIYKHLLISILLVSLYVVMSFMLVNEMKSTYYMLPLVLFVCVVWLIWNTYPTNRIASTVFIVFITVFLYSNFIYSSTATLHEFFMNASRISLDLLKQQSCQLTPNATQAVSSYNIFFVESNFDTQFIRPRQLCAIESAASHNPRANVYVMSINAQLKDKKLLDEYKNIMWMTLKPDEVFSGTPLWSWWKSKRVFKSQFKTAHLSDALRLALLWKYGGVYSDLDTVTIKSFVPLLNFSGAGFLNGKEPSLGNGFLHFRIGHPFLYLIMEKFARDYNPDIWGFNGPILLRQTMAKYCQVDNIYKSLILNLNFYDSPLMLDSNETDYYTNNSYTFNLFNQTASSLKCDLVVYPQQFFYPYNNYQLSYLFDKRTSLNVTAFMSTYSVHFYGKVSSRYKVKLKESSAYEYFASNNCELVYKDFKLGLIHL